jgi:hypothetical protein
MKSFTIEIDTDGATEINLKGFEERSPELAAIVEQATGGKVKTRKWAPGNHAHTHTHNGQKVTHKH